MDEEKLISLVMGYPELYDLENEHYMNQTRKNNIWMEISGIMGVDDATCKDKWKALRDAYNRCLKRRKSKSGDGAKKIKKWRFESQMEFLLPYFQERTSKTNINPVVIDDKVDQDSNSDTVASTSSAPVNSPRPFSRATSTPDFDTAASTSSAPKSFAKIMKSTVFKKITARKKSNQNNQQSQSQVANALERYLENKTMSRAVASTSSIHSFFNAMADTVVALSPSLQLKVKNQVYSIVSEAEFENLHQMSVSSVPTRCELTPNLSLSRQAQPADYMRSSPFGSISQVTANTEPSQPSQSIVCSVVSQTESEISRQTPLSLVSTGCELTQNIISRKAQPADNTDQSQPQYRYLINPNGDITFEECQ